MLLISSFIICPTYAQTAAFCEGARSDLDQTTNLKSSDSDLMTKMEAMAEEFNQKLYKKAKDERWPETRSKKLFKFIWKYRTLEKRVNNFKNYLRDIRQIIAATNVGKDVEQCFTEVGDLQLDPDKNSLPVRFMVDGDNINQSMAFMLNHANDTKTIERIIEFDIATNPISAIVRLAHEMQHSCNAPTLYPIEKEYKKAFASINLFGSDNSGDQTFAKYKQMRREIDQERAVDEMKAYQITYQLFRELASWSPSLVCNVKTLNRLYGGNIDRLSDRYATMERQYLDKTFPLFLIGKYVDLKSSGRFLQQNIFVGSDGSEYISLLDHQGLRIFRQDMQNKLRLAGF